MTSLLYINYIGNFWTKINVQFNLNFANVRFSECGLHYINNLIILANDTIFKNVSLHSVYDLIYPLSTPSFCLKNT